MILLFIGLPLLMRRDSTHGPFNAFALQTLSNRLLPVPAARPSASAGGYQGYASIYAARTHINMQIVEPGLPKADERQRRVDPVLRQLWRNLHDLHPGSDPQITALCPH
jgi:hypothetical protein